jgi:hypothetical protein
MLDEAALRARYSLVEIDEEGVLLDRESGAVFRLNRTARAIWAQLMAGASLATIVATIVRRFGIARERAERDARATLVDLVAAGSYPTAGQIETSACRWQATPAGYAFLNDHVVTCEVDGEGTMLRLPRGARPTEGEARAWVRSVVPRVLALRGIHLLHASAVELDGALTVFTGPSGAGKTTTARAFVRSGARLISEDLLVLAPSSSNRRAVVDGEAAIRRWVAERAARLAVHPDEAIPCDELDRCVDGDHLPIAQVLVIDAARRAGDRIQIEPLSRPDALVALMESVYFASSDTTTWHDRLETLRDLVRTTNTARATMPQGLTPLGASASAFCQTEKIAS